MDESKAKNSMKTKDRDEGLVITRTFDAPRDVVWEVYTDPDLIPQWWGPRNMTKTVDKIEVKEGGTWRVIQKDEQGNVYGFHGVIRKSGNLSSFLIHSTMNRLAPGTS